MLDKAGLDRIDELKSLIEQNKSINHEIQEKVNKRLDDLKTDHEEQAKELMDQMLTLETKIDKIEEEGEEEHSYDEESDQDLGSELEDKLDVNDLNTGLPGGGRSGDEDDAEEDHGDEGDEPAEGNDEESDLQDASRSQDQLSAKNPSAKAEAAKKATPTESVPEPEETLSPSKLPDNLGHDATLPKPAKLQLQ